MNSVDPSEYRRRRQQAARLATVAIAAITCFALIIVALHLMNTGHNPLRRPTSEYAIGPYGFLMTFAFLSMTLCCTALALGLNRGVSAPGRFRIGLILLGAFGVCAAIAAAFPIDVQGAPRTAHGTIHRINAALAFLSLTIGVMLVSWRFRQDDKWRSFHRWALILALVMLVAYVATAVSMVTGSGFPGLWQRIFLAGFVTWVVMTATRLRAVLAASVRG